MTSIPTTIEGAYEQLADIGGLVSATEWERSAIVYAFTEPDAGHGGKETASNGRLSCTAFAKLGISGLKSKSTVSKYHDIWADAIKNHRAKDVKPGDSFVIPKVMWPGTGRDKASIGRASISTKAEHAEVTAETLLKQMPNETLVELVHKMAESGDEELEEAVVADAEAIVKQSKAPSASAKAKPSEPDTPGGEMQRYLASIDADMLDLLHLLEEGEVSSESIQWNTTFALQVNGHWDEIRTLVGIGLSNADLEALKVGERS